MGIRIRLKIQELFSNIPLSVNGMNPALPVVIRKLQENKI